MRNAFALPEPAGAAPPAYERRVLQVVTLGFWGPSCVADAWLLARGGLGAGGFVFGLLFREAVVFLALWFAAGAAYGVMRGRRGPRDPSRAFRRKLRARLDEKGSGHVAPTRGNRGQ